MRYVVTIRCMELHSPGKESWVHIIPWSVQLRSEGLGIVPSHPGYRHQVSKIKNTGGNARFSPGKQAVCLEGDNLLDSDFRSNLGQSTQKAIGQC